MTNYSSSGFDSLEFKAVAEDLWALLNSPFEPDLDPLKYKARLVLPIETESAVHRRQEYSDYVRLLTHKEMCRTSPWEIDIAYNSSAKELGVSKISIPLNTPARENLIFQSTAQGFIPLHEQVGILHEIPSPIGMEQIPNSATSNYAGKLMLSAGYDFRRLGSHPDKLRLRMAELIDASSEATIEESAVVLSDISLQTAITRTMHKQEEYDSALQSTSLIDWASVSGGKSAAKNPLRQTITTDLQAVSEFFRPNLSVREQLVIEFSGADFSIDKPAIYKQRLRQASDEFSGWDYTGQYVVESRQEIEPTIEVLERLTDGFIDSMS